MVDGMLLSDDVLRENMLRTISIITLKTNSQ